MDYSNPTTEASGTLTYTATKRCKVYFMGYTATSAFVGYKVNDTLLFQANASFSNALPRSQCVCDLDIGDTFTCNVVSGSFTETTLTHIPYGA